MTENERGQWLAEIQKRDAKIAELEAYIRDNTVNKQAAERRFAAAEAETVALIEALTPSADTKAAYIDEFSWDEDDPESFGTITQTVPWTTVKEIMAAIRARAAARGAK